MLKSLWRDRENRIYLIIILFLIISSLHVSFDINQYFNEELQKFDRGIVEKIQSISYDEFTNKIDLIIHSGDVVLVVDKSKKVIESAGAVVDESFKAQVHENISISSQKITLEREKLDLDTYVVDLDVKTNEIYRISLDNSKNTIYYIPKRKKQVNMFLKVFLNIISVHLVDGGIFVVLVFWSIQGLKND